MAKFHRGPRPGFPGCRPRRHRAQQQDADPACHLPLLGYQQHTARPPGQPRPARRHVMRLSPDRLGPVPPRGRQQPHRSPPGRGREQAPPVHGTAGAASPRPRCGRLPRRAALRPSSASARSASASAASASAVVALASPSAVSRYRWRRGRPGTGSSCQHASTRPRSASRIRIGYSVPDFSPVCRASAYPCCHPRRLLAQRRQHRECLRRELATRSHRASYLCRPPFST